MDILYRIRQLLAGDNSRKRKAEENAPSLSSVSKKCRTNLQKFNKEPQFNFESNNGSINNFGIKRRYSDLFVNSKTSDNFLMRQENPSNQFSLNNLVFQNGGSNSHLLYNEYSNNYQRTTPSIVVKPQPSIKINRKASTLIRKEQLPTSQVSASSSLLSSRQQLQTGNPGRAKFSQIPDLYSIKSTNSHSTMNGQPHLDGNQLSNKQSDSNKMGFTDFSAAKVFYNPLSLRQCTAVDSLEKNIPNGRDHEKEQYSKLLRLFPFYKQKTKTSNKTDKPPKCIETIDLLIDNDNTKTSTISSRSNSSIAPVNSLRERLSAKTAYGSKWMNEVNTHYDERGKSRAEFKKVEEKRALQAQKETQERERSLIEKTTSLKITETIVLEVKEEEEEPINDFPPLSQQQVQKIYEYISSRDPRAILIEKFSLSISKHDIQTLCWNPLTWLNDEVINFYMELLAERSKLNENLPKVYSMNTFFLKRLTEVGYSGVRRWTRKVDIFSYDVIPIPVHKGIHWCMAIINLREKTIKYYDSMGAPNNQVLKALEDYLQSESLDKKNTQFDTSDWKKENVQNIPQQENGSDCGVFSCMYAEFVTRERPITFSQQHMEYFRMKMIYEICTGKLIV